MLGVVFLVVPGMFGFMIWRSYKNADIAVARSDAEVNPDVQTAPPNRRE